jgi:SAM-dependent methyltransferase
MRLISKFKINSSRIYLEDFVHNAAASLPGGARVLDAGAGEGFYRHFFAHTQYHAADFLKVMKGYGRVTYICDLEKIPSAPESYDGVICTQVLEHIPEPGLVLEEFFRILKPGGELWLSAPLFYQEHEIPYDFYRYTQFGFRYLLERKGFQILEMHWLEGYYGTLAYQLEMAARELPLRPADYGGGARGWLSSILSALLKPGFYALSLLFSRLDLHHPYFAGGMCKNYILHAVRPPTT